jgi:hypothetical protein
MTALRERVEWANDTYERDVLPETKARQREREQGITEREQRLEDAQRKLDELE